MIFNLLKKIINRFIKIFKKKRLLIHYIDQKNITKFIKYSKISPSQLGQDIFVLEKLNYMKKGFFVEFGADDGIKLSNTYLLEKEFNWSGIVAEPAIIHRDILKKNRNCHIENKCVFSESGKVSYFTETKITELSFLNKHPPNDQKVDEELANERKNGLTYKVETISLNDLLQKYNCPKIFEYLSIDTEGTEYEIIKNLNFNRFLPKIITIEHNYDKIIRDKIFNLLTKYKYTRTLKKVSHWDDWYVHSDFIK